LNIQKSEQITASSNTGISHSQINATIELFFIY